MYSGPSLVGISVTFYDTTSNVVQRYDGGSLTISGLSFPIALITGDSTQITSIDQVFNGFGYIGNTIFVLPGVEALIPNGRNVDGTLKNKKTVSSLFTKTESGYTGSQTLVLGNLTIDNYVTIKYDVDNNFNVSSRGTKLTLCICGMIQRVNGIVTSLQVKNTFHAVDYSEYKPEVDSKLNKSGDTMTGRLTMGANDIYFANPNGTYLHMITDGSNWDLRGDATWLRFNPSQFGLTLRDMLGAQDFFKVLDSKTVKDYIVDRYSDEEGNWYEVYASGWIKQGGIGVYTGLVGEQTVTLLKPMANANYSLMPLMVSKRGGNDQFPVLTSVTTTNFKFTVVNAIAGVAPLFTWRAEGYKAQGA